MPGKQAAEKGAGSDAASTPSNYLTIRGKTSLAAATGIKLAALNYRTLVMSIDPAHSLGDSFDLETDLFHLQTSDPLQVGDRLWIHELNIQKEIKRHWQEISSYVTSV